MATVGTVTFEIPGADGGPLRGEVRTAEPGAGRPAVIICHGFKGFKDWGFFPHLAQRLARAGLTSVSFNFSGSGVGPDGESFSEKERFARATFSNDLADLGRVQRRLEGGTLAPGIPPISAWGLFGHSRGGGTAVLYAGRHRTCRALVTWAAIATVLRWDVATVERWREAGFLDIVNTRTGEVLPVGTGVLDDLAAHADGELNIARAAGEVRSPWLILHGEEDEGVPVAEAASLHRAARVGMAELRTIPHGGHTFGARHPWAGSTPELDEVMDLTVGWFARHLV